MARKGEWVQVHQIVLKPEERPAHLPEDTKKVPLELWVKGFLNHDAEIGDEVEITTLTGRTIKGELVEINPKYEYGFGEFVPELLQVGIQLRSILKDGECHE
ncbi:2-amino-4-ketopentanoate thiolase subunit alpha [Fervidicella metallireducens AeB]|uniref:2-amino-4-ketopentanoate thiolase subunit alpha n=1 Tax=Fervidicella metallireducens AeB TaxID=1403537 RepID=A0A017RY07_9CLOT|nr:2-amino-4-oxopentanoate thiolase subunit OrtA [Fervidicella metallireducens]EYE89648.1 2-amino-4-ketopentanoate thiolase subunit alpha [Fervidicella metallireducens AeB]